jgi:hypothetical protein
VTVCLSMSPLLCLTHVSLSSALASSLLSLHVRWQDMTPVENKRLRLLFEDGMSTLTAAVEQLSSALEADVRHLHALSRGTNKADKLVVRHHVLPYSFQGTEAITNFADRERDFADRPSLDVSSREGRARPGRMPNLTWWWHPPAHHDGSCCVGGRGP